MRKYPKTDRSATARRARAVDEVRGRWASLPRLAPPCFVDVKRGRLPYGETWRLLERAALSAGAPERWTRRAMYNAVVFAQIGRESEAA